MSVDRPSLHIGEVKDIKISRKNRIMAMAEKWHKHFLLTKFRKDHPGIFPKDYK